MSWSSTFKKVEPYIVKIETPSGAGTGFFFAYNEVKDFVGIATALHVVQDVDDWRQPLKIARVKENKELFVEHSERVVIVDYERDSAVILIRVDALESAGLRVPDQMLPIMPSHKFKTIGVHLAWAGYPAIASRTLCLFQGSVSAFDEDDDSYYIDGIAINGVSGGPVFDEKDKGPEIVGIVSAYHYNRASGGNLPGLLMAHDATHLNDIVEGIKNMDEAKRAAAKATADQKEQQAQTTSGPPEPDGTRPRNDTPPSSTASGS